MASSRLERIGTIYSRKQLHEKMLKNLFGVLHQLEKDKGIIKENNERLNCVLEQSVKLSQQTSSTVKQRITGLNEILNTFHKQVEGLMRSKAMKPQDRSLWWDIYRAFPPLDDPVFSRPLPTGTVRKIFYPEDEIRAQFHKSGEPVGVVKINDDKNKTNTQKFIAIYNNIENSAENPDKNEIFKDSVEMLHEYLAIKNEWRDQTKPEKNINTKQSSSEALKKSHSVDTIKDIFKE